MRAWRVSRSHTASPRANLAIDALENGHTPIDARLRATLEFLEKLVLFPGDVTPADTTRARDAGAGSQALREAAYVAFAFGVMDRLADAFGFEVETGRALRWTARILLRLGYGMASVPG